ncbi:MAG: Ig-like domain-containing protein, partial [Gemmatimonadaceae bacterium]
AAAGACGGGGDAASPGGPVAAVAVSPDSLRLSIGASGRLGAVLTDADGGVLRGREVFWSSADTSVAAVDRDGLVTAKRAGAVLVSANCEGHSGLAQVVVRPPGTVSVTVDPSSATLLVGQSTTLVATVRDGQGEVVGDRPPTWASSNSGVASVSQQGVVTGLSAGSATITASRDGASGSASVTVQLVPVSGVMVTPAEPTIDRGRTVQLTAVAYDGQGKVLAGRSFTWSSSDPTVATVSGTGLVLGRKEGQVTITATSEGQSGSARVTVRR